MNFTKNRRNLFLLLALSVSTIGFAQSKPTSTKKNAMHSIENKWVLAADDFPFDSVVFRLFNAKKDNKIVHTWYQFTDSGTIQRNHHIPAGTFYCRFGEPFLFKGIWSLKGDELTLLMESGYKGTWVDKHDLCYRIAKQTKSELILVKQKSEN
jgi:hypothetical protein